MAINLSDNINMAEEIKNELIEIFYEGTEENIKKIPKTVNFKKLKTALLNEQAILKKILTFTSENDFSKVTKEEIKYIFTIYPLTSLFAEFIRQESIQYQVIFKGTDSDGEIILTDQMLLPWEEYLKTQVISFEFQRSRKGLLKQQKGVLNDLLRKQEYAKKISQEYKNLYNEHYKKIMASMQPVEGGNITYMVSHYIMKSYGYPKNLFYKGRENTKMPNNYQHFRMGHIAEGLSTAVSYYLRERIENPKVSESLIEYQFYTRFLNYDNAKYMTGGDNPFDKKRNFQVKLEDATITSLTTLAKSVNDILNLLDWFNKPKLDKEKIKTQIKSLFSDAERDKWVNKNIDNMATKATNKIIKQIFDK